jgi:hypothetical protein
MRQCTEKVEDIAQYVIGAPRFVAVAAPTALVMVVAFPVVEAYISVSVRQRLSAHASSGRTIRPTTEASRTRPLRGRG